MTNTLNNSKCLKLVKILNSDDQTITKFMRKHKLTLYDYRVLEACLVDILTFAKAFTFNSLVVNVFKKYGFNTELDTHKVNYIIT